MEVDVDPARRRHREIASFNEEMAGATVAAAIGRATVAPRCANVPLNPPTRAREASSKQGGTAHAAHHNDADGRDACLRSRLPAPLPRRGSQDWPTRPMTMVIPFAAAGGVDVVGRIMGARWLRDPRPAVIIENVGGAGGDGRLGPRGEGSAGRLPVRRWAVSSAPTRRTRRSKEATLQPATDFAPVALVAETADRPGRAQRPSGRQPVEVHRLRQGEPGEDAVRLARLRLVDASACALFNVAIGVTRSRISPIAPAARDPGPDRRPASTTSARPALAAVPQIEGKQAKMIATLTRERWRHRPCDLPSAHEQGARRISRPTSGTRCSCRRRRPPPSSTPSRRTLAAMNTPAIVDRLKDIGATIVAPERRAPEYLQKFVERKSRMGGRHQGRRCHGE